MLLLQTSWHSVKQDFCQPAYCYEYDENQGWCVQHDDCLLSVTEKSHAPQDPVIWVFVGLEQQWEDVGQVSTSWLLVHRALVVVGCLRLFRVDCKDVHDWYVSVEDLG